MPDGLSDMEARQRLARDGPNELPASRPRSRLRLLRGIVADPMFLLLLACGGIYMLLGDKREALMLLGFVLVVMVMTYFQQQRTERSLDALRDLSSPQALVMRGGQLSRVASRELVCGDVVLLAEGVRVPADLVLTEASNLQVDESLLTGESVPIDKSVSTVAAEGAQDPAALHLAQVFSGTLVTRGTARGHVVATGEQSQLGRIGVSLRGLGEETTPIQRETRRIVQWVAVLGLVLAACLAVAYGLLLGDWLHGLLAGLTLAMAILPEELTVILTVFMGLGAWRLAREKVLTRNVPTIELLGATTVLCVDKTGTLTSNQMAVRRLWSGTAGYDTLPGLPLPEALHEVLEFAVLASHRQALDPMDTAIADAGQRLLAHTAHLHADWTLVDDYALSPAMLAMSRVWQSPDCHERIIAAKGSPEAIIDLCHLNPATRSQIVKQVELWAADGLRVLGVAQARFAAETLPGKQHDFAFAFSGLLALEDPLRPEVPAAIAECHAAGIKVVMITGDHPVTALAIARQAGLPVSGGVMTGQALAAYSAAELAQQISNITVFCRILPAQKLRLVQAFRDSGAVVAMTGDGVNDAPALKAAHIGVAMGAHGTDVAREAADVVLLKDDFASLVTAVRYGRRVFTNLRKAIVFVVAVHVPIVGLSVVPVLLGWPMLLMPVHVLFLQLVIDPACSIVFEAQPSEPDAMTKPPRSPASRLFDAKVLALGLWQGTGLLVVLLAVYAFVKSETASDDIARALTFFVLILSNLCLIQANRSWGRAGKQAAGTAYRYLAWISLATCLLLAATLYVPAIRQLFGFVAPSAMWLLFGVAVAAVNLLWFEVAKRLVFIRHKHMS